MSPARSRSTTTSTPSTSPARPGASPLDRVRRRRRRSRSLQLGLRALGRVTRTTGRRRASTLVAASGPERQATSLALRVLLEAYRRTGADPPFGDPRRAHGVRFEGYYWRFTDAAAGRVVIVLCGVCRDAGRHLGAGRPRRPPRRPGALRGRAGCARRSATGSASRPRTSCAASPSALRVDLGPDARLDVALREPAAVAAARVRRHRPGPDRPRAAAVLAPAPARRARRRGGAAGGRRPSTCPARPPTRRRTGAPPSPSTGGGARRRASPGADACVAFAGGRVALAGVGGADRGRRRARGPGPAARAARSPA